MKIKIWVSFRGETFETIHPVEYFGYTEKEWSELTLEEQERAIRIEASQEFDYGYKEISK